MASSNARAEVGPRGGRAACCSSTRAQVETRSLRADREHQQSTPGRSDGVGQPRADSRRTKGSVRLVGTPGADRIACRSPGGPVGLGLPGTSPWSWRRNSRRRIRPGPGVAPTAAPAGGFSTRVDIAVDNRGVGMGTPAADDLWVKVAAAVRAQLSEATWNTWFQGVHALDCTDETLMLGVPSSVAVERIRTSYLGLLADAVQALTGVPHTIELMRRHRAPGRRRRGARAPARRAGRRRRRAHPHPGGRARQRVAQHPAESPLHVRPVRHRCLEPLRPRRGAERRREPGPFVQPAVHLRPGRTRQDPPCCTRSATTCASCSPASASATSRPRR